MNLREVCEGDLETAQISRANIHDMAKELTPERCDPAVVP